MHEGVRRCAGSARTTKAAVKQINPSCPHTLAPSHSSRPYNRANALKSYGRFIRNSLTESRAAHGRDSRRAWFVQIGRGDSAAARRFAGQGGKGTHGAVRIGGRGEGPRPASGKPRGHSGSPLKIKRATPRVGNVEVIRSGEAAPHFRHITDFPSALLAQTADEKCTGLFRPGTAPQKKKMPQTQSVRRSVPLPAGPIPAARPGDGAADVGGPSIAAPHPRNGNRTVQAKT